MGTSVSLNSVSYTIPATGEGSWGTNVSSYLIALATGVLTKSGGAFTLTADANFGATYGLSAAYYKARQSGASAVSSAGHFRLANTDSIGWRNAANSADLLLTANSSNLLTYGGNQVAILGTGSITSAQLLAALTDETGTGSAVFATSPTLVTPVLGVATATSINGTSIPSSKTLVVTTDKISALAATTSSELAGVISDETGSGALVFGTSPSLTTPQVAAGSYVDLLTQAAVRFNDDSGGEYVALQAPTGVTTHTLKLPATQGAASTTLTNDGSGNLTWAAAASASLNQNNTDIGNSSNTRTATNTALLGDITATTSTGTVTMTIATPGVFTLNSHGMANGAKFYLTTTGALPTGLSASTTYYASNVATNTFNASTTLANAKAGTYITTSGSQSGVHSIFMGGMVLTSGVKGTITNDTATAGYVGERIYSNVANGSAIAAAASGSDKTLTSVTLTAGQWLVSGIVYFQCAATTSITSTEAGFSLTNNTLGGTRGNPSVTGEWWTLNQFSALVPSGAVNLVVPPTTVQLASSTTLYMVAGANYTVSTMTLWGYIEAVRIR